MHDNKVSEKAIWEGAITPDNDTPPIGSQMQTQSQMMFCYKCNNVIPSNSTFCPYCQIKLFTECPKCGTKYSSQYPACNNCGTNREEYLRAQRREQERKEAIERENRRQKEAYIEGNEEIKKTKEYKDTYSLLSKAIENHRKRSIDMQWIFAPLYTIIIMFLLFCLHTALGVILGFILGLVLPFFSDSIIEKANLKIYKKYLQKYISRNNNYNNHIVTQNLIDMVLYQGEEKLSECCIIAYRERYGLPINYKWHNVR